MTGRSGRQLTAEEAAAVLGVKPATLYAYVSRGRLTRLRTAEGSRFDAADVERLARSSRRAQAAGGAPVGFASELTLIEGGSYSYRGRDAVGLSRTAAFEDVAGWLWTGTGPGSSPAWEAPAGGPKDGPAWAPGGGPEDGPVPETGGGPQSSPVWEAPAAGLEVARAACAALPPSTGPTDRWKVAVAAAASVDPLRHDRAPATVTALARGLIATLVEVLPLAERTGGAERTGDAEHRGGGAPTSGAGPSSAVEHEGSVMGSSIAGRLWPRLSPVPPTAARVACLDAALVLLADHEIAASTLAARTAAAVGADPYAVVLTGMSAAGGPLHAASSLQIEPLLAAAERYGAAAAVGELLRRGGELHGFGHPLYPDGDPRGAELLARLHAAGAETGPVDGLLELLAGRGTPPPNVDFGLAALAHSHLMVPGASEAIFVLARCAGWVAHALEEYAQRSRFRVRATYVGPRPEGPAPA